MTNESKEKEKGKETGVNCKLEMGGRISKQTSIQMDFDNGTTFIAPENVAFTKNILDDIGDIIDIGCKLTGWCGGDNGGGGGTSSGSGCYTIITPDGTKITICPPPQMAIA